MNIAVILSGGVGSRLSPEVPKQYLTVAGRMVITRCLERFWSHPLIHWVQIVAAPEWRERILAEMPDTQKFRGFSQPGENRQGSVRNALLDLEGFAAPEDGVLIHDAARPLVPAELITGCFRALEGHDGVMPVLPMTDTVYYSEGGGRVDRLLPRERIFAGQAPEAFRFGSYLAANRRLTPEGLAAIRGSSEPAVLAGLDVALIPGEAGNFKLTVPEDLARYEAMLAKSKEAEK